MKSSLSFLLLVLVMLGCQTDRKDYASSTSAESLADLENTDSTATPKIIKTADMRFRVKDVQQTKEKLSAAIKTQGGSVAEFTIESVIQESDKVKYSLDSLKEITSYRKEGSLVAKIPSEKLDDFTNAVAKMAVFVNQQSMKMDDESITYLSNKLKAQNRAEALQTISETAKRKGNNVETSLYIKDNYVDRKLENLAIDNKVKFSTITLNFYQDNTVHTLVVGNDNLRDYGPGFFKRMGLSLVTGWSFLKELILGLITLWPLLALGLIIFLTVSFVMKKKRSALPGVVNDPQPLTHNP